MPTLGYGSFFVLKRNFMGRSELNRKLMVPDFGCASIKRVDLLGVVVRLQHI